jgi:hypothetical protein
MEGLKLIMNFGTNATNGLASKATYKIQFTLDTVFICCHTTQGARVSADTMLLL